MHQEPLFYREGALRDFFEVKKSLIKSEIEFHEKKLLNMDEEELIKYFIDKNSMQPPILHEDKKYIFSEHEICTKGISITIAIPFEGDPNLFYYAPSRYTHSRPCGDIEGMEIHLIYQRTEHDAEKLNRDIKNDTHKIQEYLSWVQQDVEQYNNSLEPYIRYVIKLRKEKLKKDLDLVSSLGIPIRKHPDVPKTYYVPKIRKKPKIELQKDIEKPSELEPVLNPSDYDDILNTIQSMAITIERNPRAFMDMDEEDLRWILLVPLNAIYKGEASGEIFNYEGKTDILIREKNKNLFISECKIWRGEKGLFDAIDQLLGYTSWRDTKTAVILFFRGKNFSKILEKIPEVVKSHSCYISDIGIKEETIFQYKFHHRDDINRELILSVMAFHVPN